jgi:hypothetical protein
MAGRQHLRDRPARIVGDEIELAEIQALAELGEHVCQRADRQRLARQRRTPAVEG